MFQSKLRDIRHRTNRRTAALFLIFAVGLSWTGLSSLALLTDNISATVNGSITTIDFRVNGTKAATVNLADGAIPGDYRFASLQFTNSGTGYVRSTATSSIQSGGGQLTNDSRMSVWVGVAPAQCNFAGLPGSGASFSNPRALDTGLWDGERQVDAGGTLDVCVWYRLGTTGATYTDGISSFSQLNAFNGFYP